MYDLASLNTILESTKKMSVLYIEDDKKVHEITIKLLEHFFNSVDSSFDGEDGLRKYLNHIEEHGYSYDLVITDITMPLMNGIDMSKEIIKKEPNQMIVAISAENSYLKEARELFIGFLSKPARGPEFSNLIFNISKSIMATKPIY